MSNKKGFRAKAALAQAEGLAQVAESYLTTVIVLNGIDTSVLPEAAQGYVKTALNTFAYSVSDIATKYSKLSGRKLDLAHVEAAFQVPASEIETND